MKYRKRPVVVDAIRWTGDNASEVTAFVGRRPGTTEDAFQLPDASSQWDQARVWAEAEGCWMRCPVGHWVIRGIKGEFYPHEPAAFDLVYERVDQDPDQPPPLRGPLVGASAVVLREGRVLLGRRRGAHGGGTYAFPGGKISPGEQPIDAVIREIREETGLVVHDVRPVTWTSDIFTGDGFHYVTLHHVAEVGTDAHARLREPEKCDGWDWYSWDELPSPLFLPAAHLVESGWRPPAVAGSGLAPGPHRSVRRHHSRAGSSPGTIL